MAEQGKAPDNQKDLEHLKQRQDAVLNKIGSLQSRLNKIQRERNVPYDVSNISSQQFKQIKIKQAAIFERLLNIAGQIDKVATKQNLDLPATNEVSSIIETMSNDLEKRQKRSLTQLKVLSGIANSIQSMQLTPQIEALINNVDDTTDKKEDMNIEEDEKTTTNTFKSRTYDLELVSECLRIQCQRMDNDETGKITKEQLITLLDKVSLVGIDGSVKDETHINKIFDTLTADTIIEYNKLLDLVLDFSDNNQLETEWNTFRYNLIGKGRVDGTLRIYYRYDAWPEPVQIVIKDIDTKDKNKLGLKDVLEYIQNNTKDIVEYKELRCALNPTFVPGKRGWEALNHEDIDNEKVSFLLNNDGTLEIDIWLRTKDFIANNQGRALPEENEDDLVDID
mmetsp:Transcript_68515/g.61562  ORF Transcript_68515/g.61562 Transcript_68515/m.61562 type:complete len:394 (-) Transcript_68515:69-1250(-)